MGLGSAAFFVVGRRAAVARFATCAGGVRPPGHRCRRRTQTRAHAIVEIGSRATAGGRVPQPARRATPDRIRRSRQPDAAPVPASRRRVAPRHSQADVAQAVSRRPLQRSTRAGRLRRDGGRRDQKCRQRSDRDVLHSMISGRARVLQCPVRAGASSGTTYAACRRAVRAAPGRPDGRRSRRTCSPAWLRYPANVAAAIAGCRPRHTA